MPRWAFGLMERLCLWPRKCLISFFFAVQTSVMFFNSWQRSGKKSLFVLADCGDRFQYRTGCESCGAGKAGVGFSFLRGFELGLLLVVGSRCRVVAANGSGCHRRREVAEFEVLHLR